MMHGLATELWIRLYDGRVVCEKYNQREMAEFVRERMIGRIERGEILVCYDEEPVEIPASGVERIDLVEPVVAE